MTVPPRITGICSTCWFANGDGVSGHCGKCVCCHCGNCGQRVDVCGGCIEEDEVAVVPVVRFDGGKPPHQVHYPTRPGWRWGWCDCPIGETHNENARP